MSLSQLFSSLSFIPDNCPFPIKRNLVGVNWVQIQLPPLLIIYPWPNYPVTLFLLPKASFSHMNNSGKKMLTSWGFVKNHTYHVNRIGHVVNAPYCIYPCGHWPYPSTGRAFHFTSWSPFLPKHSFGNLNTITPPKV